MRDGIIYMYIYMETGSVATFMNQLSSRKTEQFGVTLTDFDLCSERRWIRN